MRGESQLQREINNACASIQTQYGSALTTEELKRTLTTLLAEKRALQIRQRFEGYNVDDLRGALDLLGEQAKADAGKHQGKRGKSRR